MSVSGRIRRAIAGVFIGVSVALAVPTASLAASLPAVTTRDDNQPVPPLQRPAAVAQMEAELRSTVPPNSDPGRP